MCKYDNKSIMLTTRKVRCCRLVTMASEDELESWKRRAEADGFETMSAWVRAKLNRAAAEEPQGEREAA